MALQEFHSTEEMRAFYSSLQRKMRTLAAPQPRPQPQPQPSPPPPPPLPVSEPPPPKVADANFKQHWFAPRLVPLDGADEDPIVPVRAPTAPEIVRAVCRHYNISAIEITSQRRTKMVALARQVAMWLMRTMTGHTLPRIGYYLGDRDHTTVLYGWRNIEIRRVSEPELQAAIDSLTAELDRIAAKPIGF